MSSLYTALPQLNYTNQVDPSSLASYGQQAASAVPAVSTAVNNVASTASDSSSLLDWFSNPSNIFGGTNAQGKQSTGYAMPALSLIGGLASFMQGNAAQDLAKSQLKESQRQFDTNLATQKKTVNTELEDRQRARVAAGGSGAYESVDSYMSRNKL